MGLLLEEKTVRKLRKECKRVEFNLTAETSDFIKGNEESCYDCYITVYDAGGIEERYRKRFLITEYTDKVYECFLNRFCQDEHFRELFNVKHDVYEPSTGEIDVRIAGIVTRLNDAGFQTEYSCQGTDAPWSDRPCKHDSHSTTAYIKFQDRLPKKFISLLQKDDRLFVLSDCVYALMRKYNVVFPEIFEKALDAYLKHKMKTKRERPLFNSLFEK